MFAFVGIVVQVIDPGTVDRAHVGDEVVDHLVIETIFLQGILHTIFSHPEFVDVSEGVCCQFQGHAIEGPIGEFDRERFMFVGLSIYKLYAVEDGLVAMVVPGNVQGLA